MLLPVSDVNVDVTCFDHDERSEASTTRTKGAPQRYFHKHPKTKEVCFKPERKDKSISPCATRGPSASIMREPESQTHTSLPLLPAEGDFYPRSIPEHWKCIPMDEDETMKTRDPVRHRNWRGHPSRRDILPHIALVRKLDAKARRGQEEKRYVCAEWRRARQRSGWRWRDGEARVRVVGKWCRLIADY